MNWVKGIHLLALAALVSVGCAASTPPLVPVTGTVKLDGSPVAGALVSFWPMTESLEPTASATTDGNGAFSLRYHKQKAGAPVGEYKVTLSTERIDIEGAETFPPQYHNLDQTILHVTVAEGGSTFDFAAQTRPNR